MGERKNQSEEEYKREDKAKVSVGLQKGREDKGRQKKDTELPNT